MEKILQKFLMSRMISWSLILPENVTELGQK
jgi:hypothetical protein